ncbi:MAG: PD40 domain-containing protein [Firmicutes bacterium]|nr:PD40 domain-containing protein [Bacillota bacterium]
MKRLFDSERRVITDVTTGRQVTQITNHESINHQPFFLIPAYDRAMKRLYFVSHRTGSPQVFAYNFGEDVIEQLSDVESLNEWSVHPSADGQFVYYVANGCAMRSFVETGESEVLLSGKDLAEIGGGKVNPGTSPITPGTTAVSADDRYWAIRAVNDGVFTILIYDNLDKKWRAECSCDMVSHMQFCPDDSNLLFCAGPLKDRVWVLDRASGERKRIYTRDAANKQWITHESWIPGKRALSLVDWPHGILEVSYDTQEVKRIATFNAWHAIANYQGTKMVADTNFPDNGLIVQDLVTGRAQLLCRPDASCIGAHWNGPFPYDNGPIKTYAPQHTHPHPRFSPDDRKVVYTSDKSGFAQVFEIEVP